MPRRIILSLTIAIAALLLGLVLAFFSRSTSFSAASAFLRSPANHPIRCASHRKRTGAGANPQPIRLSAA